MPKLTRYLQKVFGDIAGVNQLSEFGSAAAGGFVGGNTYDGSTITPDIVQQLSNYSEGYFAAVDGEFNPAIEDENALNWLWSRQLKYLTQQGVAEWIATETYWVGSVVSVSTGGLYISLANTNLNNAVTDVTKWARIDSGGAFIKVSGTGNTAIPDATTLPAGTRIEYVKTDSVATTVTFTLTGGQTLSGVATGVYTLTEQYSFVAMRTDGANWFIVSAG